MTVGEALTRLFEAFSQSAQSTTAGGSRLNEGPKSISRVYVCPCLHLNPARVPLTPLLIPGDLRDAALVEQMAVSQENRIGLLDRI